MTSYFEPINLFRKANKQKLLANIHNSFILILALLLIKKR